MLLDPAEEPKARVSNKNRNQNRHEHNPCRLTTGTETRSSDKIFSYKGRNLVAQAHREAMPGQQIALPLSS